MGRLFSFQQVFHTESRKRKLLRQSVGNYRAKLANGPLGRQGQASRFAKKSSSPCGLSVFFRKTLPYRGTFAAKALVVHDRLPKPEYSNLKHKIMEQNIMTGTWSTASIRRQPAEEASPALTAEMSSGRTTGPVPISALLDPIRRISRHPDRNRLLAEYFRQQRDA